MPFPLPPPQLLEISGADALAFAQAQFCSDLRGVPEREWRWSAWLSPQGRVRAVFRLLHLDHGRWLLQLSGGSATELRAQLLRYVLRAKVELRLRDAGAVAFTDAAELERELGTGAPAAHAVAVGENRMAIRLDGDEPRWLLFGETGSPMAPVGDEDARWRHWRALDVRAGIVEVGPELGDRLLPDWLALPRLGAVSVNKGCYPGQEIVARLHFKGGNKRWLYHVAFDAASLPVPGTPLGGPDGIAGELVAAAWDGQPAAIGLAVLPHVAPGSRLTSEGAAVEFRVISPVAGASD